MNTFLLVLGGAVAAYLILGEMRTADYNAAIAACGGAQAVTANPLSASGQVQCPLLLATQQKWAWYPSSYFSL